MPLNLEQQKELLHLYDESLLRIKTLKDSELGKPCLICGLGPSLLKIDKDRYKNCIKIVCNNFQWVPNFFINDYAPNYWCGANSYEVLAKNVVACAQKNISVLVTIPLMEEMYNLLLGIKDAEYYKNIHPWYWAGGVLQALVSEKFNSPETYSLGQSVLVHMIALSLWLGCNPIYVAGIDFSYHTEGPTHAGFSEQDALSNRSLLDSAKYPVFKDLEILAKYAKSVGTKIFNLSSDQNGWPVEFTA